MNSKNDMNTSSKKGELSDQEKTLGLFALEAQRRSHAPQLSEKTLQDYYAGRLSEEECDSVFEYLDSHPEAYEQWEAYALKYKQESEKKEANATSFFIDRLNNLSKMWFGRQSFSYALALGLVGVLIMLGQWPKLTVQDIRDDLNSDYVQVKGYDLENALSSLEWPWEERDSIQGFSPLTPSSPESIAFAAGLVHGKAMLSRGLSGQHFETSEEASYQVLGQWNVMLWAVARSKHDLGSEFWRKQHDLAQSFVTLISSSDHSDMARRHLEKMAVISEKLIQTPDNPRALLEAERELSRFRQALSPKETQE